MSIQIHDATTIPSLIATLTAAAEPQEVRGPHGEVLGVFTPAPKPKMSFPEFGVTDEELLRELNDPNTKWYTPEQVMERLREIDRCSP